VLWVGNLPPSTTQKELQEFFLPWKSQITLYSHTNSAKVYFNSVDEAKEALEKKQNVHFRGIRLVFDFAKVQIFHEVVVCEIEFITNSQ
jgi:RNA recognition motif-containing protein